jgi:hypothetical protein
MGQFVSSEIHDAFMKSLELPKDSKFAAQDSKLDHNFASYFCYLPPHLSPPLPL